MLFGIPAMTIGYKQQFINSERHLACASPWTLWVLLEATQPTVSGPLSCRGNSACRHRPHPRAERGTGGSLLPFSSRTSHRSIRHQARLYGTVRDGTCPRIRCAGLVSCSPWSLGTFQDAEPAPPTNGERRCREKRMARILMRGATYRRRHLRAFAMRQKSLILSGRRCGAIRPRRSRQFGAPVMREERPGGAWPLNLENYLASDRRAEAF